MLAIQTPMQADMMKAFGNEKVVCIDATHGTNGYDFSLITVLVTDEFGEGYPVAWCLSNRTDLTLLLSFFKSIKNRIGVIIPKWIMTDDADQYYSAWVGVFGLGPQKLLCVWHVDRAWRGHLNSIRNKEMAQKIYHNLRVLLEETDQSNFERLLLETQEQMSKTTQTEEFHKYFKSYYTTRKREWALCYRRSSHINTNMYVEAFHRVIKYLYLKGKTNKRVDKCVQMLLKYERDKCFERLTKIEKGKLSDRITKIMRRHTTSRKMSTTLIKIVDNVTWKVKSSDSKHDYTVVKEKTKCHVNCELKCLECNTCVHMYYCNCMDALIHHTMCKHIHLVSMHTTGNAQKPKGSTGVTDTVPSNTHAPLLHSLQQQAKHRDIANVKQRLIKTLSSLTLQVSQCNSVEGLLSAEKQILSAKTACRMISVASKAVSTFPNKKIVPANKTITKQRPFVSTKRKTKKQTIKLAKPSTKEKSVICNALNAKKSLYSDDTCNLGLSTSDIQLKKRVSSKYHIAS